MGYMTSITILKCIYWRENAAKFMLIVTMLTEGQSKLSAVHVYQMWSLNEDEFIRKTRISLFVWRLQRGSLVKVLLTPAVLVALICKGSRRPADLHKGREKKLESFCKVIFHF